ncbi:MAG TPA: MarR family transcriptional regulator [Actinomycetota bacterium]|nr:MarR family transcriptional regulator [Actinomycetota bacterium]
MSRPERFEKLMRESARDLDASRAVVALARADGVITRRMDEALAGTGVSGPKFNVLMELAAAPEGRLPLSEVARRLLKSPPNMTTLIDRLEADGWVRRVRPPGDRRVVMAEITPDGWKALRRACPRVFATEKDLLSCLTATRRRDLAGLLDTVTAEAAGR